MPITIDWTRVKDVLEAVAALIVILGVPPIAAKQVAQLWRTWFAPRRAQARVLDRLCCGEPMASVNSWLGSPVLSRGSVHTYELPGAWVQIVEADGVVLSFAVTIRKKRLHYNAAKLTVGNLRVELGRSTFGAINSRDDAPEVAYAEGNRRVGYAQRYYFGNPGHYQHYVLAFNTAGAGDLTATGSAMAAEPEDSRKMAIQAHTTVNTLMVYGPATRAIPPLEGFIGVEPDEVRLRLAPGSRATASGL